MHVYGWVGACAPLSGGQKTLCESGLSLYCVGPNDQTQVMGLSSQCLFPVNHFTGRQFNTGPVGAVETVKCLSMIATLPPLRGLLPSFQRWFREVRHLAQRPELQ